MDVHDGWAAVHRGADADWNGSRDGNVDDDVAHWQTDGPRQAARDDECVKESWYGNVNVSGGACVSASGDHDFAPYQVVGVAWNHHRDGHECDGGDRPQDQSQDQARLPDQSHEDRTHAGAARHQDDDEGDDLIHCHDAAHHDPPSAAVIASLPFPSSSCPCPCLDPCCFHLHHHHPHSHLPPHSHERVQDHQDEDAAAGRDPVNRANPNERVGSALHSPPSFTFTFNWGRLQNAEQWRRNSDSLFPTLHTASRVCACLL